MSRIVRVGVGVLIKDSQDPTRVFCGIRKGSHGAGSLALPGGHLEMYETWEECAIREVSEETDLKLEEVTFGHVTNDPMPSESKHYVTIFMLGTYRGEVRPKTMEPNKCEGWSSFSWNELKGLRARGKLFGPLDRLVQESPKSIVDFVGG